MTKEEIIKKHLPKYRMCAEVANASMDEYAKQECVDFAGFIAAEYFIHPNGVTFYHYRKSIRGGECMQEDELTKEHLYELYEQSKNKQQ